MLVEKVSITLLDAPGVHEQRASDVLVDRIVVLDGAHGRLFIAKAVERVAAQAVRPTESGQLGERDVAVWTLDPFDDGAQYQHAVALVEIDVAGELCAVMPERVVTDARRVAAEQLQVGAAGGGASHVSQVDDEVEVRLEGGDAVCKA